MSWLGSFGVLPSPNHVLAKLAIFRGAEHSPHSPRATDSAAVFYYYFKPFAAATAVPPPPRRCRRRRRRRRPLSPTESLSFAGFIPSALLTASSARRPPRSSLLLSPPSQAGPPATLPHPFRRFASTPSPLIPPPPPLAVAPRAFGRR
jgi:hypothetical protein